MQNKVVQKQPGQTYFTSALNMRHRYVQNSSFSALSPSWQSCDYLFGRARLSSRVKHARSKLVSCSINKPLAHRRAQWLLFTHYILRMYTVLLGHCIVFAERAIAVFVSSVVRYAPRYCVDMNFTQKWSQNTQKSQIPKTRLHCILIYSCAGVVIHCLQEARASQMERFAYCILAHRYKSTKSCWCGYPAPPRLRWHSAVRVTHIDAA